MKNSNVILKTVLNVLIALIALGLYVLAIVNAYGLYNGNLLVYAVLLVAGAILSTFIYSLVHELGHLIAGLIAGLKFSKICVLIFLLELENEKLKFKLVKPTEFGYTEMLPKHQKDYGEKLAVSATGGLVFSVLIALASMAVCINNLENVYMFTLFGASYPLALYIFFVNALPFFNSSDGALIFSILAEDKNSALKNYYSVMASVLTGVEPGEIKQGQLEIFNDKPYSQNLKYIKYLHYLNTDFDKAYEYILNLSKSQIIDDDLYFIVKKEIFFCKAVLGDEGFIEENAFNIVGDIDVSDDLCNYRVHATYRIFIKDYKVAGLILKNGVDVLSKKAQNGFVKSELKYLKDLQNQLNNLESL